MSKFFIVGAIACSLGAILGLGFDIKLGFYFAAGGTFIALLSLFGF